MNLRTALLRSLTPLALLAEAVALALALARGSAAGEPEWPLWGLAAGLLMLAGIRIVSRREVRLSWRLATGLQALLTAVWLGAVVGGAADPEAWAEARRAETEPLLSELRAVVPRLPVAADSLLTFHGDAADFRLADVQRDWSELWAAGDRFPLALALWRDGERVRWQGDLEPFPTGTLPVDRPRVEQGRDGWYWVGATPVATGLVEWQIRLAGPDDGPGEPFRMGGEVVRARIIHALEPGRGRWVGSARQGLWRDLDIALETDTGDMELPWLRLTVHVPSLLEERQRENARLALAGLLLCGALLVLVGRVRGGLAGTLVGLWATRLLWSVGDMTDWLATAVVGPGVAASPGHPASLLDPTYFASARWGGFFASTFDAILTGLVVALSAGLLELALRRRPESRPTRAGRRGLLFALGYGLVVAALLRLLSELALEWVVNANPRLIGPKVPFQVASFWGLHLALVLVTVPFCALLAGVGETLRRATVGRRLPLVLCGALAGTLLFEADGLVWWMALPPLLAVLLWYGSRRRSPRGAPARRLALLLPMLAAILWNYVSLSRAYDAGSRQWLLGKADEIVAEQDDFAWFLMEDLLREIAGAGVTAANAPTAHAADAAELWRHWSAYELWRQVDLGSLRMPCLVEVLDEDGFSSSLFASGFFRDFGYQIVERSDWEAGRPLALGPNRASNHFLQTERRRYASGDELILRGEVERLGMGGWISLELPVRSWRTRTLRDRLAGVEPSSGAGGYTPRLEIDQPLLLMRRDQDGWRDTGGFDPPDRDAERILASLRSGERPWAVVRVDGDRYLSLWREDTAGDGFLLGLRLPEAGDRLLDFSRLLMLDLVVIGVLAGLMALARLPLRRRRMAPFTLQERFLAVFLVLGLLPLLLAGSFIDRLSREWLEEGVRDEARAGLETAEVQLQGLLAEQARALAGSDYIADLLEQRLAEGRPVGPFGSRQAMIFDADGALLLDETLSDLDDDEAAALLEAARSSSLVLMRDAGGAYLGTLIPVDLSGFEGGAPVDDDALGPVAPRRNGWFLYRQRLDTDLLVGLGDVISGEAVLYAEGEAILSSHPGRLFSGATELMLEPAILTRLRRQPGNIHLEPLPGREHSWTGMLSLPAFSNRDGDRRMVRGEEPAVLAVAFSDRARDFVGQRERTVLFLAGLATLIFLTAAVLGLVLAWKIFDPVRVLVDATRRLAGGDFDAPLPEPGRDEIGTLAASFGTMRDELRETQDVLADRERFLARLLERVPVGVAVYGRDSTVLRLNPAAEAILNEAFADAAATTDTRAAALLRGVQRQVAGAEGSAELTTPGGRTLRGRLAPLTAPDGQSNPMVVFEDVTEFLDNKRQALNAQLARQVAHEVKNPLTPIQLSVQFLQQAWRDGAGDMDGIVDRTVKQVLEQVELLRRIATEFSLLGRPDDLEKVPLDFAAVVRDVTGRYVVPGAAGEGPHIQGLDDGDPPAVLGDAESLAKVVGNLMENSLQAVASVEALNVRISWVVTPATVTLRWADDGPGLPPDVADRLFDLYFSTKSRGTGLGLPICRNLLARMGGEIRLSNRVDRTGALAEVVLQRADARPVTPHEDPEGPR